MEVLRDGVDDRALLRVLELLAPLASAPCVIAARWSDPSGFLTILIGDIATDCFVGRAGRGLAGGLDLEVSSVSISPAPPAPPLLVELG